MEAWISNKLAVAANTYQTFTERIWQVIIEKTQQGDLSMSTKPRSWPD